MKRLLVRDEVCMGCRLCEVYCLVSHSRSGDPIKAYKGETPRALSRVEVQVRGAAAYPLACLQCDDPPCVASCLTGALYQAEHTGLVTVDESRCTGCWTCVAFCPYGAIAPDLEREVIAKCDLCPSLPLPACVARCPNQALLLAED